jgi:putative membrane protein
MTRDRRLLAAGLLLAVLLALSGLRPYERGTWLMEVAPILIAGPVLVATYRRFPLTTLLYALLFCHALILMVGGIFTYARVPLGFWVQDLFQLGRNPYDKLGHFAQGLVPALLTREIVLRTGAVSGKRMAGFVGICVAMTVSACYELVEWGAALALGQGADAFLGTQGDPWDTQSDMLYALIGAAVSMLALARLHDRAMARLEKENAAP